MKVDREEVLVENGGYCIQKSDDFYIQYGRGNLLSHWEKGFSIILDEDEMEEFLETMTDKENQEKMKNELILIRLRNEVENKVKESIR